VPVHDFAQAGSRGIQRRVCAHFRRVEEQLLAADQPRVGAQLHNMVEEAAEEGQAVALADLAQARVVGQGLIEMVAQVPAVRQVEAGGRDELALGADPLEEHDQLQAEENHRVDARPTALGVASRDPAAHEGEVERGVKMTVEMVRRHQRLQRGHHRPVQAARLWRPQHANPLSAARARWRYYGRAR